MTFLLLQIVGAAPPDIELNAVVHARSLTIEKRGEASLTVTTEPDGGNVVNIQAPKADGQGKIRNAVVQVE